MSEQNTSEAPGESLDTAVVVSRSVSQPIKDVWKALMTAEGSAALLGPGAVLGQKGHTWRSEDGRTGVIRSFHPLEQIRFTFRQDEDAPAGMVQLQLTPEDEDTTTITLEHSKLNSEPEWIRQRWEAALDKIVADCLS